MPTTPHPAGIRAIPRTAQRDEPWANGAGSTTVILREPDAADWRIRISVARVEHDGPFSNLPVTERTLIPLDAAMTLRFADGREDRAARLGALHFEGAPAPEGVLPEGPTRDFNLMLREGARGEALARPLVGTMMLLQNEPAARRLVFIARGSATLHAGDDGRLELSAGDAALIEPEAGPARIEGSGEIVLARLYA